ncbi:asparagine synthase (glutamine-hydrolyzing) [Brevibacillus fulvus]|uniref:asparagine synthase (glutamine-hydrolyzing) n=1 Tax=Brevibacillus fulvus TaxID=1125967 RepID=A0A939BQU6_9BACL|nr:asparagine synthase (glutamine-hydrolyzing) [Brevibacillus fulvus]MBM7588902.1 asparagine synthase (glutamine-hydrolyzing) [Brevibacillus fulvus]
MCGIAGIVTMTGDLELPRLQRAAALQAHRGPDSQGLAIYQAGHWQVGFAHQRLSIIDCTEAGAQPFVLEDGQGALIYNGEVYNYRELRQELQTLGWQFQSDCDTEVVLKALHQWGIAKALSRFNGMWAFAWLDRRKRQLYLCRDRFGVKPLYYAKVAGELVFASEIKTVKELAGRCFSLNHQVIGAYVQQSLLAADEQTFYQGIEKVPSRHTLCLDLSADKIDIDLEPYWEFPVEAEPVASEAALTEQIKALFTDAVRLRLRSDVPVGVLLSGGIDSSSIAAIMNQLVPAEANLHILSAVSDDQRFDESRYIDVMSKYLQQPVHKVMLQFAPGQAFDYLHQVTWHNDEPISSFSTIAHYLLMRQAKQLGITVILSGQGADELLCGYRKYLGFYLQALVRTGKFRQAHQLFHAFRKQGTILSQFSYSEAKRYLPSFLRSREEDIAGEALRDYQPIELGLPARMTVIERQKLDIARFSVPALTHYEDRMSMAWSREVRLPFLDYRLVELLLPLSPACKLRDGWSKYVFRQAMQSVLPAEIVWRKDKQGFINPQSEWLKQELREEVLRYFAPDSLIFTHGLIDRNKLLAKYERYRLQPAGQGAIWFRDIFQPLALEVWLRQCYR